MNLYLLIASLLAVSCRRVNVPLAPIPLIQDSRLRSGSPRYVIAAAPTYWTDDVETVIALQSDEVNLLGATAEWSFDDSHIQLVSGQNTLQVVTRVVGYTGSWKTVIISCWVTPLGRARELVRARMDILPQQRPTTSAIATTSSGTLITIETTTPVAIETTTPVAIETTTPVAIETTTPVAIETTSSVAIETTTPVAIDTTSSIAIETTTPVATEITTPVVLVQAS